MWDGYYQFFFRSGQSYLVIYTETIVTRFYWLTCKKQKLVQSKALQQRLFDLILGFWQCRQVFLHYLISIIGANNWIAVAVRWTIKYVSAPNLSMFWIRLAEKQQEVEGEHMQMQRVMCFMQKQ